MDVADKGVESASKSLTIIPTDDPLTIPKTTNSGAMLTTKKSGRQSPRLADEDGFLTPHSWFSWFLILLIPDFWCLILHSWFLIDWLPNDHCFGQAIWTDYNRSSRSRSPNALHFIKHDPFDYYAPFFFSLFVLFFWCSHSPIGRSVDLRYRFDGGHCCFIWTCNLSRLMAWSGGIACVRLSLHWGK